MFDLGGADPEGQRTESAMGGGVGITADDGHAGQGETLFRADDMNDALADIIHFQIGNIELGAVCGQCFHLGTAFFIRNALVTAFGRNVMVRNRQRLAGAADRAARIPQPFECLGAGDFVNHVAIDIEQAGAILLNVDNMRVPDLVKERTG